jgi:hypothetical protein
MPTHVLRADRVAGSTGWGSALEVVLLAPLSAGLVLGLVPAAFGVEWECSGGYGIVRTVGDEYVSAFAVVGAAGWLAVAVVVLFAQIFEWRRAGLVLPLAWFAVLVVSAIVAAAAIGPAACETGARAVPIEESSGAHPDRREAVP